jgi:hypothetical protein
MGIAEKICGDLMGGAAEVRSMYLRQVRAARLEMKKHELSFVDRSVAIGPRCSVSQLANERRKVNHG